MNACLVFIPCYLYNEEPGYLYGKVEISPTRTSTTFYILGKSHVPPSNSENDREVIGYYCKDSSLESSCTLFKENWVIVTLRCSEFHVQVHYDGSGDLSHTDTISILFNHKTFLSSELILDSDNDCVPYRNNFKALTYHLKQDRSKPHEQNSFVFAFILRLLLSAVRWVLGISVGLQPLLCYSSLGLHAISRLESLAWALETSLAAGRFTLKVGNLMVATGVNVCCGLLVLYCIGNMATLHNTLLDMAEVVVVSLRSLLRWLMGSPAGLKLNHALTNMLGQFFLYHINLWWTFLVVTKPLLELTVNLFLYSGVLGLTFQAALLADLLALVSFHVYCIYVYAARLYSLQVSALAALCRLFRGKKHNPLRHRVDSCRYSTDQLFVGTLALTILLFLMPTTLLYYAVFTSLRLCMVGIGGLLTQVSFALQALPLYVTTLWVIKSPAVTSSIHLSVQCSEPLVLSAQPVSESLLRVLTGSVPDSIQPPPPVAWGRLLASLASGALIYPV